jgi:hypothetical protein
MNTELWVNKTFSFELDNSELPAVLDKLRETPVKIKQIVTGVPEEILNKKSHGKWSVKENIGHLADLEELHDKRIDDFLENRHILHAADINNKKTHNAHHNKNDVTLLLDEFKTERDKFINRIEKLDENIYTRISLHPRLNQPMRIIDLAQFIAEHDDHHIETIRQIIFENQ